MSYADLPLREYFALRAKESFSLDPWTDSEIYFGDTKVIDRISKRLETDFVQPRGVPKFFIYGGYGSGKTHSLANISYQLNLNNMHPAEPIYVDIAPLSSRERFVRIYSRFLDAIGLERLHLAAEVVADRLVGTDKVKGFLDEGILPFGDDTVTISQANVFRNLLFGGRQSQLSWEWMKGRKNTPDQSITLGVQKDLTEPADLVNCLLNVGSLYFHGTGKKIVLLIDEAEAIRSVTMPDSQTEIIHMIRLLLENSNTFIGTIFAIQTEGGMEEIGEFFTREDIRRRVDYDQGFIDLGTMVSEVQSAKDFILHILEYLVDQDRADELIHEEGLDTTKTLFPFTESAIDKISEHVAENPELASPAYILSIMSNAAVEAWRRRGQSDTRLLVDTSIVEETAFPEG